MPKWRSDKGIDFIPEDEAAKIKAGLLPPLSREEVEKRRLAEKQARQDKYSKEEQEFDKKLRQTYDKIMGERNG
jgi:hypothetical protein